jgi:hypothetical protein
MNQEQIYVQYMIYYGRIEMKFKLLYHVMYWSNS